MAAVPGLVDVHVHLFGGTPLESLAAPTPGATLGGLAAGLVEDPAAHPTPAMAERRAARWLDELDAHGLAAAGCVSDHPDEAPALCAAAAVSGRRLAPFAHLDPTAPGAREAAEELFGRRGVVGLVWTPALHGYLPDDESARPVLELCASLAAPVIVHAGLLPPGLADREGPRPFEPERSSPLHLVPAALRFPRVPFVVPRFGGGFLRETLLAGEVCGNVHVDTSSDHAWLRTQATRLRLEDVLERALGVFGPDRILFGTGSTLGTRGWRHDLFTLQREALGALEVSAADQTLVFRDNARRLLGL